MTFSIIIPVYNVAPYLRECLSSIAIAIEQCKGKSVSCKVENVEVFCIDDGSTDGSGAILDDYAVKYGSWLGVLGSGMRIKVIHQPNQGVSAARNRGLEEASGEYVCFVDADDKVGPEWLENYARAIEKYNRPDLIRINALTGETDEFHYIGKQALEWAWTKWVQNGYVWTYCIRREISVRAKFPIDVKYCEDSMYEMQLTPYIKKAIQLSSNGYSYRITVDSASNQWFGSAERVVALKMLKGICHDLNYVHPLVMAGAIWGALSSWAHRPKDTKFKREILNLFYELKSEGFTSVKSISTREKPFALVTIATGWIWPLRIYSVVLSLLVRIKRILNNEH